MFHTIYCESTRGPYVIFLEGCYIFDPERFLNFQHTAKRIQEPTIPDDTVSLFQWSMTRQYAFEILTSSYYAQAIQLPGIWQNRGGSFLALSTKDSTRCMKGNWEDIRRGHLITHPAWLEYDVWFLPGSCMLQRHGYPREPSPGALRREVGLGIGAIIC